MAENRKSLRMNLVTGITKGEVGGNSYLGLSKKKEKIEIEIRYKTEDTRLKTKRKVRSTMYQVF